MEYIEQSYKSIIFYFINNIIDQGIFNVVSKHQFKHLGIDIEMGVLTESHFVSVSLDNDTVYEICACKNYDFNTNDSLKLNIVDTIEDKISKKTKTFTYNFSSTIEDYRAGKKTLSKLQSKQREAETHYLTHTFPGRWLWSRPAITEIYVTTKASKLVIESVHTYPNESKMVFTNSEILKN